MKKMLTVLVLLALASNAFAQDLHYIGIFSDEMATGCSADATTPYATVVVHFVGLIDTGIQAVSAVEFKVDGLPTAGEALTTPAWNTTLAIGELGVGLALAFNPALDAPMAYLGSVSFFLLADLGVDRTLSVMPADLQSDVWVVDSEAEGYNTYAATGCMFTFNCVECPECCGTATEESSWGGIKALY